jgi:protein-S-isoprenylcysteine O-methyltransferase Ste14/uncharacterized membrane protein (UPF0127 family)
MARPTLRARVAATGALLAERLRVADTRWTRLRGLLGTRELPPGGGLWIRPCDQVHMIGMRYPVDLVFLDAGGRVVRTLPGLRPWRVSPRVRGARSVLELPAETLARTPLADGTAVEIEGAAAPAADGRGAGLERMAANVAIALLYALFVASHLAVAHRTGRWTTLPIIVQEALLVVLFLTRRPSVAVSTRPLDWLVGMVGTFLPLLMRATDEPGALHRAGEAVQVLGLGLAIAGLTCLGRSVGVVAANRGVRTGGAYRLVRHPMYVAYAVSYVGYVAAHPSLRNAGITAVVLVALHARALAEERVLGEDPAYRRYAAGVRWRFVPGVY